MSTKLAHAAPLVVIVATFAAALSISIATASPTGAEPHQIPVYTSHQKITDPNKIFPGQVITIPKSTNTYVIRRGDTLSGIAKKFGISLAALEAANHVGSHHAG
jgi:LysM repeat protein